VIEDLIIGMVIGFSLPFLIRFRVDILEFLNLRKKETEKQK